MVNKDRPVLSWQGFREAGLKERPGVLRHREAAALKMGVKSWTFLLDDDFHRCLEKMHRVTWVGFKPELTELGEKGHYGLKEHQVIVLNHSYEGVYDLGEIVDFSKDGTPVCKG